MKDQNRLWLSTTALTLALGSGAALAQQGSGQTMPQSNPYGSQQQQQTNPRSGSGMQQGGQSGSGMQGPQSGMQQGGSTQGQQSGQSSASNQSSSQSGNNELNQLAEQNSDISQFVHALEEVGLGDALTSGTAYTIFAPTNEAFGSRADELMRPENRQELISVLRAHIVADDVDEQMARNISEARTVDGGTVEISSDNGQLKVGDANVVKSDIEQLGNLRVYAIDQVLQSNAGQQTASNERSRDTQAAADRERPSY